MKQTVYHGSPYVVEKPEYGKGRSYNDYGAGFYLTNNKNLAGEWAVFTTGKDGYVNEYTLDYSNLNILKLDELPVEVWIAVLMNNRYGNYKKALRNRADTLYKQAKERDDYARQQYNEMSNPEKGTTIFDLIGSDN